MDLLWPPRTTCLLCGGPLGDGAAMPPVCPTCWSAMAYPEGVHRCANCARPLMDETRLCADCEAGPLFGRVFALGLHEGALREAIHLLKFEGRDDLGVPLGRRLALFIAERHDLVVPVPLHRARFAERGYNQAALVAHGIRRETGTPVVAGALRRVRNTGHQAKLDRTGRLLNLAGAFTAPTRPPWAGRRVLLVDDVLTTGATASAAADVVRKTGAAHVNLAVLAVSTTLVHGNLTNTH